MANENTAFYYDLPKRAVVAGAEWHVSVELVRGDTVLERSSAPLRFADSWLTASSKDHPRWHRTQEAGMNLVRFVDDLAMRRSRTEAAQKKAAKKK